VTAMTDAAGRGEGWMRGAATLGNRVWGAEKWVSK